MTLILVLLYIITAGLGLGLLVAHPLACLYACLRRPDFAPKQRIVWALLILLTAPIGSCVYAIWREPDPRFRALTIQALAGFAVSLCALIGVSYLIPPPLDQFTSYAVEVRPR